MLEQTLTMQVLPPTLNEIIEVARQNKFASAGIKKKWTNDIALAAKAAKTKPIGGRVYLEYVWRVKNLRRDQDNITSAQKYILDGLVAGGIIEQDNLTVIQSPVVHWFEKGDHDGFSIIIRDGEAWLSRLKALSLNLPPTLPNQTFLTVTGNATHRISKARPRARARTIPTSRRKSTRLA